MQHHTWEFAAAQTERARSGAKDRELITGSVTIFLPGKVQIYGTYHTARFASTSARVFPDMFSLAQAHQALDDAGQIRSEQLSARFEGNIAAFMDLVEAAKHYPCANKAWIEFLGEQPDAVTDRVE